MPIPSKLTPIDQPTDPRLVFVKSSAQVYNSTATLSSALYDKTTMIRTPSALDCVSDESSHLLAGYPLYPTSSMTLTVSPTQSPPSTPTAIKSYLSKSPPPYSPTPSSPNYTPPKYTSTSSMSLSDQIPMRDTLSVLKTGDNGIPLKFMKSPPTPINTHNICFQVSPLPYIKPFSAPVPTLPISNAMLNAVHETDEVEATITHRTNVGALPDDPKEFDFTPAVPSSISAPPVPFIQ
jgi:hypothetical protein